MEMIITGGYYFEIYHISRKKTSCRFSQKTFNNSQLCCTTQ